MKGTVQWNVTVTVLHLNFLKVWAVGSEDGLIYARTDVSTEELVGREWKLLKERDPREADKTGNLDMITALSPTYSCEYKFTNHLD